MRETELEGDHPLSYRPVIRIAEDATITLRRPLEENASLYAEFANLDGSEKACLDFAHKYGTLFHANSAKTRIITNQPELDSFMNWKHEIKNIRDIIRRCELSRSNPAEAFRRFGKRDKRIFGATMLLSVKNPHSPATLEIWTETLIAGIQLQAIRSILLEGRKSVQCFECSRPFEIGGGARRSQSKFCSTRCKDNYHNRLKAQGRRTNDA